MRALFGALYEQADRLSGPYGFHAVFDRPGQEEDAAQRHGVLHVPTAIPEPPNRKRLQVGHGCAR